MNNQELLITILGSAALIGYFWLMHYDMKQLKKDQEDEDL